MAWSSPYRRMPTDQPGHRRSRMPSKITPSTLAPAGVVQQRSTATPATAPSGSIPPGPRSDWYDRHRPIQIELQIRWLHQVETVRHRAGPSPTDLESVLGATLHEFESRILRQCLTRHDVEGPHCSRWSPSTCVVVVAAVRPGWRPN